MPSISDDGTKIDGDLRIHGKTLNNNQRYAFPRGNVLRTLFFLTYTEGLDKEDEHGRKVFIVG